MHAASDIFEIKNGRDASLSIDGEYAKLVDFIVRYTTSDFFVLLFSIFKFVMVEGQNIENTQKMLLQPFHHNQRKQVLPTSNIT